MAWIKKTDLEKFANKFAAKITELFAKKADIPSSLPASGGDAATVNGHSVNADVPSNAKFTDTTYGVFVKSGGGAKAGLVPSPGTTAGTKKYLREDGTWQTPPDNNTTYSNMTAATANAAGKAGLVPAPPAGKQNAFLKGDGTWEELEEVTDAEIDAIIAGTFK